MPYAVCAHVSGTYGHEARNQVTSRVIFDQSWKQKVGEDMPGEPLVLDERLHLADFCLS
jgi:hypothetical protein